MVFRPKNPVTITCEWCGVKKTLKMARADRDVAVCGRKCSVAWHRQRDAETTWRMMELTRLLWQSRPEGFRFEPKEFPGLARFRVEMNATGKWVREISSDAATSESA